MLGCGFLGGRKEMIELLVCLGWVFRFLWPIEEGDGFGVAVIFWVFFLVVVSGLNPLLLAKMWRG